MPGASCLEGAECLVPRATVRSRSSHKAQANEAPTKHEEPRTRHHFCGSGPAGVAEDVGGRAGREIREFSVLPECPLAREPALLQHVRRWSMSDVAQRVQMLDAARSSDIDHRPKGFSRETLPPGVLGDHVSGGRSVRRFKRKASAADQTPVVA